MGNNSIINGNIYSNGTIVGANGAQINGDGTSAGSGGKIEKVTVTGTAKAHIIKDCTVNGDAYYVAKTNCTVDGTSFPGSSDPSAQNLPIGDDQINAWRDQAAAGEIYDGSMTINSSGTLGPIKINGSLSVGNSVTLTLMGTVWVTGAVSFGNYVNVVLDPSYGSGSEVFGAHGAISLGNSAVFTPADEDGYIMLLSEYNGTAISIGNSADAVILYARNGTISVGNNIELKSVTANQIVLGNGAILNYEEGLADASFTSGPGGSWVFSPGTYVSE